MTANQSTNYICLIEDNAIQAMQLESLLKKYLSCGVERISRPFPNFSDEPEGLRNLLDDQQEEPRFIITDICLNEGENNIITECIKNANFQELVDISGIKLLTWLRHKHPMIPVISMSGFWDQGNLPDIMQHSLLFLHKNDLLSFPDILIPCLKIAGIKIFGVFLDEKLSETCFNDFIIITDKINNCQNSFYFHIATDRKKLITPPEKFLPSSSGYQAKKISFEIWCKNIVGIINFTSSNSDEVDNFYSVPFGSNSIHINNINIYDIFEYIGTSKSASYIAREYLRTVYQSFYQIKLHDSTNPKCLFTDSIYEDSFPKHEQILCLNCMSNIRKQYAFTNSWLKNHDLEGIAYFLQTDNRTEKGDAQ